MNDPNQLAQIMLNQIDPEVMQQALSLVAGKFGYIHEQEIARMNANARAEGMGSSNELSTDQWVAMYSNITFV